METEIRRDRVNWIKNLIQVMCADGSVADREKAFLFKVAKQLGVDVPDWNALCKSVMRDARVRYPLSDEATAHAVLKSLIVMANADGRVDDNERRYILSFAKVVGVSNGQLKEMVGGMSGKNRSGRSAGSPKAVLITAASDDFKDIDQFVQVVGDQGHEIRTATVDEVVARRTPAGIVCFHAADGRDGTVQRYKRLAQAASGPIVAVLTRYQGHHVRYLLELGIARCVIEPVYARDIEQIAALAGV